LARGLRSSEASSSDMWSSESDIAVRAARLTRLAGS
jgi:hypothetical protein